jgi:FOG: CheY-like receiver
MNSIAEYSEIEQGSFELKTGSVSVTDIIDNLQEEVKLKGLNYGKISSSLKFITDKNKFQSFVNSFVKVAIGLSKEKKVYLSAFQYNTSHFAICVKDRTNGISDDLLKYLKMIFEKGDLSTTRDFGISKMLIKLTAKLAEVLQGEATVIEKGGAATEFGFVFPYDVSNIIINEEEVEKPIEVKPSEHEKYEAAENNVIPAMTENNILLQNYSSVESESANIVKQENSLAETTPLSEKGSLSLSSLSCLYIEDQTDSQILFKVQLKDLKDIKFAVSYEEALPLLQKYKFDFIVIDINLQGEYNGLDALKMIHRMPGYVSTPIVAVTAYVLPGDKDKFIAAGFIDFCAKPIFREKMIEILEKIYLK